MERKLKVEFSRYAKRPMSRVYSRIQPEKVRGWALAPKPVGLWLTVDGEYDWYWWCRAERFPCGHLRYKVRLVHEERLLWLTTEQQLHDFTTSFNVDVTEYFHREGKPDLNWYGHYINWRAVAERYSGIVIAPYQWNLRMQYMWYYTWDCASACIWDASCIRSLRRMRSGEKLRLREYTRLRARMRKHPKRMRQLSKRMFPKLLAATAALKQGEK
jgi:hypothetical protein